MSEKANDHSAEDYPQGVPAEEKPERFESSTSEAPHDSAVTEHPEEQDPAVLSEPSTERDEEIPAGDDDGASSE